MEHTVSLTLFDEVWPLYQGAFEEINKHAVQRHMMTYEEFADAMEDTRIGKWLARDDDGGLVGMGIMTNDLTAWPLISPDYFEYHWPKEYLERKIWYIGFVCTRKPTAPSSTFPALISEMYMPTVEADGIAVMDFAAANVARRLPEASSKILNRVVPTTGVNIDTQHFWTFHPTRSA
ncbi:hypothetical protein ACRYCC_33210 [Actinomadura scrupuli]|uniref:hypothetical protein n=1 Tax=Actinomadura scrupuli TaxID=559629 RepID=UPI003D99E537